MKIEEYRAKIVQIFNDLEVARGGVKCFKISELCVNIIEGKTPDKSVESYWNSNDVMWFTTPDFPDNTINIEKSNQFVSKNAILDNKVKIIPINSVLLSCTATLGRTGVTRVELTTNKGFDYQ
ncbi:hypothetical protein EDL99_02650 [Ornithobacterium rhinotracheale]|nr:restriction endonuclease subunit S [Ornithobacterium rhinotracheale]MRJ07786.1 hypothetical protein [Ornithobacterium rhinotracheale]